MDEFEHWTAQARKGGRGRARAEKFTSIFDAVVDQYSALDEHDTLLELEDLVEETQSVLDDVWKAELYETDRYPEARMKHLIGERCHPSTAAGEFDRNGCVGWIRVCCN